MSDLKPCTHPVKHTNPDGSKECLICGAIVEQPTVKP